MTEIEFDDEADLIARVLGGDGQIPKSPFFHRVEPEHFASPAHAKIWAAIVQTVRSARREVIDYSAVRERLRKVGNLEAIHALGEIQVHADPVADLDTCAERVVRDYLRRSVYGQVKGITEQIHAGMSAPSILAKVQEVVDKLPRIELRQSPDLAKLVDQVIRDLEDLYISKSPFAGATTGFTELDGLLGGIGDGDLFIISSLSSMGKTAFALNMATGMVKADPQSSLAFYSLEMGGKQLALRVLAAEGNIDARRLRSGALRTSDFQRITEARARLDYGKRFKVEAGLSSLSDILADMRIKRDEGVTRFVIDYIQLVDSPSKQSREREVAEVSRSLKAFALATDSIVIALAQMNDEVYKDLDAGPQMNHIRESRAVVHDADQVMFVWRPFAVKGDSAEIVDGEGPRDAYLILKKARNGSLGKVKLRWNPETTTFSEAVRT